jgi:hypothetical protein
MEYRFIHHWQYEPGEEENKVLEKALALTAQERSESFLEEAASFVAKYTGVAYVIIGILTQENRFIRTCVFLKEKEVLGNVTYSLQGTPCEVVRTQGFCYYPFNVTHNFPEDKELQEMQIESYLGSFLLSEANEPIGIVALMHTKPIENAAFAEHLVLMLCPAIEEVLAKVV